MTKRYCNECDKVVDDPNDECNFCHACGEPLEEFCPDVLKTDDEENYDEVEFQNMILEAVKKKYAALEQRETVRIPFSEASGFNLQKNKKSLRVDFMSLTSVRYMENGKFVGEISVQDDAKKQVILFYKVYNMNSFDTIWKDMADIMTYEHTGWDIKNKMLHYQTNVRQIEKIFEMGTYLKGVA
jgi:hypothetical protein